MVLLRSHRESPKEHPRSSSCVQKRAEALSLFLSGLCKKQSCLRVVDCVSTNGRSPRSPSYSSTQMLSAVAARSSLDVIAATIILGVRFLNIAQLRCVLPAYAIRRIRAETSGDGPRLSGTSSSRCRSCTRNSACFCKLAIVFSSRWTLAFCVRRSRLSIARSVCVFRSSSCDVVYREGILGHVLSARVVDFEGRKSVS